jgi:hypothetical protein
VMPAAPPVVLTPEEVVQRLRDKGPLPGQDVNAFYSSYIGGIVLDPALMAVHADDRGGSCALRPAVPPPPESQSRRGPPLEIRRMRTALGCAGPCHKSPCLYFARRTAARLVRV